MVVANDEHGLEARENGPGQQQGALGALINIAGRQRMLSHRVVMFLALSEAPDEDDPHELLAEAEAALTGYEAGVRLLLQGDPEQGIPPLSSERVRRILAQPMGRGASGAVVLESFSTDSRTCLELLAARRDGCHRRIRALADLAGTVLLPLLNAIVAAFEEDLEEGLRLEAERAADVRAVMTGALDDIEQMASKIRMIAFNALIEAARAGDAGKAFSVIAEEIKNLGAQTRAESAKVQAAIARLFAA